MKKEERAEKVSSLHIDDLKDAMEEMGTEQVEEERKTFTITGKHQHIPCHDVIIQQFLNFCELLFQLSYTMLFAS